MIDPTSNPLSRITGAGASAGAGSSAAGTSGSASFADILKNNIDKVAQLQQDASNAVNDLATGKSDDMSGVMNAMEKGDLAFKTLISIRSKLLDAYDEIKNIGI